MKEGPMPATMPAQSPKTTTDSRLLELLAACREARWEPNAVTDLLTQFFDANGYDLGPAPYLDSDAWDRATDPALPPGVVAFKDGNGQWWRYPLAEFED